MIKLIATTIAALLLTSCAAEHSSKTPGLDEFNTQQQPTHSAQAAETAARI
jgi:hypothetical protein